MNYVHVKFCTEKDTLWKETTCTLQISFSKHFLKKFYHDQAKPSLVYNLFLSFDILFLVL